MAKHTMNNRYAAFALAACLAAMLPLAACNKQPSPDTAPLAGARIGGPFALTDQDGKPFSSNALAGRYRIVYFGYTFCPDACPTDMQVLGKAMRQFDAKDPARSAKVQPIFITVDPARDKPPELKQFVTAFHPRLIGLTGDDAQIAAVAKEYAISYRKQPAPAGASGYLMDHPRIAILFDPDGKPIEFLPVDAGADAVVAELDKWVA
jgi:protein SCO1